MTRNGADVVADDYPTVPDPVIPKRDIPTSKELILLATTDFKKREERHHRHDQSSWVSGWITGFLSERKPNWSKLREEKVRKDVLGEYYNELKKERGESLEYIDWDSIVAVYIRMQEKK